MGLLSRVAEVSPKVAEVLEDGSGVEEDSRHDESAVATPSSSSFPMVSAAIGQVGIAAAAGGGD